MAPQTHKDHITLACVLDFLQASFASLFAQREAWSRALLELLVEYHNETAAVILPQMCEYLADNFQHANVFFVGLSAGSEEEREQFAASHAVCSSYLRLLHTLSAFHCDGLEFGAHMTGSFVTSLLLHIGTSELHRAHDRATALSTLEHLVRHQDGGWQALKGVQDPNLASIAGTSATNLTHLSVLAALTASIAFMQGIPCGRLKCPPCAAPARTPGCAPAVCPSPKWTR